MVEFTATNRATQSTKVGTATRIAEKAIPYQPAETLCCSGGLTRWPSESRQAP